ncbi:DUF2628 domain-containing protein [Petrachloros mirabilis]
MKTCEHCQQQNDEAAKFCYQCGTELVKPIESAIPSEALSPIRQDEDLWRAFIGPNADRYLEKFKKFGTHQSPKFALTWNWPAFLFVSFLWFLYRKMYLYAAVYAIGPIISTMMTGDMSSGIVWSIVAGATGNYVYYWHCREQIGVIKQRSWNDINQQDAAIKETGGVQPYVIYVGIALYVLFSMTMFKMIQEGSLEEGSMPGKPAKSTVTITT